MQPDRLDQLIQSFEDKRILVIGDIMLDRFVWGSVSRISPEAPVPVVEVTRESSYPGGAANVGRNLIPFCSDVAVLGIAGTGPDASELLQLLAGEGIDTSAVIQNVAHRTIVKTRVIAQSQQVVRIDHEQPRSPSADDVAKMLTQLESRIGDLDAIIVEDYAKGLVSQAFVDGIAKLAARHDVAVTVDPNPKNPIAWKAASTVKPNRKEAFEAAGIVDPSGVVDDRLLGSMADNLFERWDTKALLITLGDQGMALVERGADSSAPFRIPTRAKEVFDVSGAGDTAIALFTLALTAGASLTEAAEISNLASGVVVGKIGTATLTSAELLDAARDLAT